MLEQLPIEVLRLIGEWLDLIEPRSVLDFAYASKHCYFTVVAISYRTLTFSTDLEKLQRDIQGYCKLLERVHGHGRVSRLIISDQLSTKTPQQKDWHRPKMSSAQYNGSNPDVFKEQKRIYDKRPVRDSDSLDLLYEEDHLWQPLATFIRQLPVLDSVFYHNYKQFPPSLLEKIHHYKPQCALYLTDFFLWSLDANGADDYEFRLLTSPCLRGIISQYEDRDGYDSYGRVTYQYEALQSMIRGLTPNLKDFYVYHQPHTIDDDEPLQERDDWNDFQGNCPRSITRSQSSGSLDSFGMAYFGLDLEEFEGWFESIDLSKLKVLRLSDFPLEAQAMEYIASCRFPSLQKLEINLYTTSLEDLDVFKAAANHFLLNLPPLTCLELYGWDPEVCAGLISETFGSRLRRLLITPTIYGSIPLQDIRSLAEVCHLVENLTIDVNRTRGDSLEVAHYRALGSFPNLRHLSLWLEPTNHIVSHTDEWRADEDDPDIIFEPRNDPTFSEFDQRHVQTNKTNDNFIPRHGQVRDTLINSALDRELADQIFHAINPGNGSLESMLVQVRFSNTLCSRLNGGDLIVLLSHIGRDHIVKRIRGNDGKLQILISCKGEDERPPQLRFYFPTWLSPMFDRVWPEVTGTWHKDWHSFPLATSPDKEIDWKARFDTTVET